ncbi:Gfo/Idh/MocA family protein [Niabella hibiscisoli]|uniref:Gfo/Idh/MocA family protein n=1 Tax=Niabella hibiscisoli TaxID=1825928 RepID=UPI001F0E0B31|nr:Gfo/Idh/MocA family oxidoreductase [Niabella hibiscisoli]MCH5718015.1 Gfo/Idh/MocA family oxidoreductase [Niabella hibiscisoli]
MTQQINWGIIGCGDVTEVKSGPAFNKVPNSKLIAVMRRNAEKAADYAQRHGVPKWYSNADELISDPEINAVYIATPPNTHAAYTMAALLAGKPVYVEKPMAMNAAEAQQMFDYAVEKDVKLCVAHYRRMQPMFLKIKSLIDSAAIGEIRFVQLQLLQSPSANLIARSEENWRTNPALSGGGLFHDLAPHQIDLMLYLFGAVKNIPVLPSIKPRPPRQMTW